MRHHYCEWNISTAWENFLKYSFGIKINWFGFRSLDHICFLFCECSPKTILVQCEWPDKAWFKNTPMVMDTKDLSPQHGGVPWPHPARPGEGVCRWVSAGETFAHGVQLGSARKGHMGRSSAAGPPSRGEPIGWIGWTPKVRGLGLPSAGGQELIARYGWDNLNAQLRFFNQCSWFGLDSFPCWSCSRWGADISVGLLIVPRFSATLLELTQRDKMVASLPPSYWGTALECGLRLCTKQQYTAFYESLEQVL